MKKHLEEKKVLIFHFRRRSYFLIAKRRKASPLFPIFSEAKRMKATDFRDLRSDAKRSDKALRFKALNRFQDSEPWSVPGDFLFFSKLKLL
jgi:hypothetical protein